MVVGLRQHHEIAQNSHARIDAAQQAGREQGEQGTTETLVAIVDETDVGLFLLGLPTRALGCSQVAGITGRLDRQNVAKGKGVYDSLNTGGGRILKNKHKTHYGK